MKEKEYIIGIRNENKKFERRTPLTPSDVKELLNSHPDLKILVEKRSDESKSEHERVFSDEEYINAGAIVVNDLKNCPVILGIKEIPINYIDFGKTYIFFSHTYKRQDYNMEMLKDLIDKKCTLVDYEMIVEDIDEKEYITKPASTIIAPASYFPRTVYFGNFAGIAGTIDSLWALGLRLESEGYKNNPFSHLKQAVNYQRKEEDFGSYEIAEKGISDAGKQIISKGLDDTLTPLIIGITGRGNTADGARKVLDLLPIREITPEELNTFNPPKEESKHTIYVVYFRSQYRSISQFETYVLHLTVLLNCIKWEKQEDRLLTRLFIKELYSDKTPRLRVIGDITCDPGGSIEFCKDVYIDNPIYTYEPHKDTDLSLKWYNDNDRKILFKKTCRDGYKGKGPVVMAVTNLPCELPKDASKVFSKMLNPYVYDLAKIDGSEEFDKLKVSRTIKRAIIVYKGQLTPDYSYLKDSLPVT